MARKRKEEIDGNGEARSVLALRLVPGQIKTVRYHALMGDSTPEAIVGGLIDAHLTPAPALADKAPTPERRAETRAATAVAGDGEDP